MFWFLLQGWNESNAWGDATCSGRRIHGYGWWTNDVPWDESTNQRTHGTANVWVWQGSHEDAYGKNKRCRYALFFKIMYWRYLQHRYTNANFTILCELYMVKSCTKIKNTSHFLVSWAKRQCNSFHSGLFFLLKQDRGYPFRGRGVVRGVRRPQVKVRPRPGKSKTTAKPKPNGKGRGTTIEIIEYV